METVSSINHSGKYKYGYLFIISLITLAAFTVALLGANGLVLALLGLLGLIITPFIYNKPNFFLFITLFVYPLTRFLSLEDKFVVTGTLYLLSFPCAVWLVSRYFSRVSKTSIYLWGMVGYILVVLLNLLRPETGFFDILKEFGRIFFAIFMIIAVYNYVQSKPDNLSKLTRYLSYLMNFIAAVSIVQYFTHFGGYVIDGFYRIRGTFTNFNDYGFILSIFLCFALYNLLIADTYKQRFHWVFTIGINSIALLATLSKTSIINVVLIVVILSMFLPLKRKLQLFASMFFLSGITLAFLYMSGAIVPLMQRFSDTRSLLWRYEMWNRLYNMIQQGDIWLGQGINASRNYLQLVLPHGESFAPHNIYLETMYNLGLVGLIPFVLVFLLILAQGIRIFIDKDVASGQNKIIGISIIVITLITMIQNFVSNAFYDRAGNIIFWVIITLLICWYNQYKSETHNEARTGFNRS